jgi:cyclopropane-fatty-acyl-phospholipid synthase
MTALDTAGSTAPLPVLDRWPALAAPAPAPVKASIARSIIRHAARLAGVRVELPGGAGWGAADRPSLRLNRPGDFFCRVGRDGLVGFGESFMAGDWDSEDIVGVLTPLARRIGILVPPALQRLRRFYDKRRSAAEDNDRGGARRNVSRHYDLSNDLFALFLDETMTYSSALFSPSPTARRPNAVYQEARDGASAQVLADAQRGKIDRLLDVCGVTDGTSLLEIGTGWGELAIRAARRGARVRSVTLSAEQGGLAASRVRAEGLGDRVDIEVRDYRDVTGRYDAIVSVEMIEAVGERWWPTYFRALDQRLAPNGRIGLQAILMPHDRMLATKDSYTWIHKYVFPGGLIPSEQAIDDSLRSHTSLAVAGRRHFGDSYAETLRHWRQRFLARADDVLAAGFDPTFLRLWEFYLAYCEAGFRAGYLDVAQLLITRTS